MTSPLEHDYIGLAHTSLPMEKSSENISSSLSSPSITSIEDKTKTTNDSSLNLKETELRLGLPGSQSPERKLSLFGKGSETNDKKSKGFGGSPLKNLMSGAKRGFSDAIDGSNGKWVFSINGKSDVELAKGAVLASPRSGLDNKNIFQQARTSVSVMKEVAGAPKSPKPVQDKNNHVPPADEHASGAPAAKAQVVGWPPIRSFRKNSMASNSAKNSEEGADCLYVKVSMDGAPYLRKVDLKTYNNYLEFSSALEKMFSCFTIGQCSSNGLPARDGLSEIRLMDLHGSEYVLTYEDKDGDWMLVGDVPWGMFAASCRRLRIMKGSEAIGLAPIAMEKCKNQN